jgi:hypothetical protein
MRCRQRFGMPAKALLEVISAARRWRGGRPIGGAIRRAVLIRKGAKGRH